MCGSSIKLDLHEQVETARNTVAVFSCDFFNLLVALFLFCVAGGSFEDDDRAKVLELGMPDDVDVAVELNNWLFALEGQDMEATWSSNNGIDISREERCWHTTFHSLLVKAKSNSMLNLDNKQKISTTQKYPVELITVRISSIFSSKTSLDLHCRDGSTRNLKTYTHMLVYMWPLVFSWI